MFSSTVFVFLFLSRSCKGGWCESFFTTHECSLVMGVFRQQLTRKGQRVTKGSAMISGSLPQKRPSCSLISASNATAADVLRWQLKHTRAASILNKQLTSKGRHDKWLFAILFANQCKQCNSGGCIKVAIETHKSSKHIVKTAHAERALTNKGRQHD